MSQNRFHVHCADVLLEPDADPAAPGGAVTMALCGSWDHAGACPWPHHTSAEWNEQLAKIRVIFVADAKDENRVRELINTALASGECEGPESKVSRWKILEVGPDVLRDSEQALASRIAGLPLPSD